MALPSDSAKASRTADFIDDFLLELSSNGCGTFYTGGWSRRPVEVPNAERAEVGRHFGTTRDSFSAMRVCQPGPVARHLWMMFSGKRIEISFLGFSERGRPPLLTLPRASMSSVSSGSSSYSSGWMTCAATRTRSEPKERCDTRLLAVIGFPHAENVAIRATRGLADDDHSIVEHGKANHPPLTMVLAYILGLEVRAGEDCLGIFEVQASVGQRRSALRTDRT